MQRKISKNGMPMRIWVGAKQTVQLRQYESAVAEMAVEVDAGTPKAEIVQAIKDADVIYTLLREKVSARAFEAKVQAAAEDGQAKVGAARPPVGRAGWAPGTGTRGGPQTGKR